MDDYADRDDRARLGAGALDRSARAAREGGGGRCRSRRRGRAGIARRARRRWAAPANVVFFSNQLDTVNETEAFRTLCSRASTATSTSIMPPASTHVFLNRIKAEAQAGEGTVSLLGALHGDYLTIQQVPHST